MILVQIKKARGFPRAEKKRILQFFNQNLHIIESCN